MVMRWQHLKKCIQGTIAVLFGLALLWFILWVYPFVCHGRDLAAMPTDINSKQHALFVKHIRKYSSEEHVLYMVLVDAGVLDMVFNFYAISIQRHKIDNYLFVSSSQHACDELQRQGVHCFFYGMDQAAEQSSNYMSVDFNRKMNMRTSAVLYALEEGISVISSDLDVVFIRDPWPSITDQCKVRAGCDVAALWDDTMYNAGFLFLNGTWASIAVFRRMKQFVRDGCLQADQIVLNAVLHQVPIIRIIKLDPDRFLNGYYFFEKKRRYFGAEEVFQCPDCVVVHNNFIISTAAKVYRFREAHMWVVDKDQYYSNPTAKYIIYENYVDFESENKNFEQAKQSLQTALAIGHILNRTVILPTFWCTDQIAFIFSHRYICPFNGVFNVAAFDGDYAAKYREHSFLSNPLVPPSVQASTSPVYRITTSSLSPSLAKTVENTADVLIKQPKDSLRGMTATELKNLFGKSHYSVLRFHSLYGNIFNYASVANDSFLQGVEKAEGFARSQYRQIQ